MFKAKASIIFMLLSILTASLTAAPTVADFTLKSLDGSAYKLSDHLGKKVIVIDFWATWCKPCKKLLKRLNKIYLANTDRVEVLAVSVDDASALSTVESYIKGRGYAFKVLLDTDSSVARMYNPSLKVPFTMIIDKAGQIAYTHSGYIPGIEKKIKAKIEELTGE